MNTPIDLTQLANALVSVVTAIISGFIIPWIRAKAGEAHATSLMKYARIGVRAAEQFAKTNPGMTGKDKYAQVEQFLVEKGFKLNTVEVKQAIEAAVFELTSAPITNTPDEFAE